VVADNALANLERLTAELLKLVDQTVQPAHASLGCGLSVIRVYWFFRTFDTAGERPADCLCSNSRAVSDTASDREGKR
jgi:hypothetical protein